MLWPPHAWSATSASIQTQLRPKGRAVTKGDILKSSIVFSLGRVKVHIGRCFYDLGLTPGMVDEIAIKVIADLKEHGRWPELDDDVPNFMGR